MPQHPLVLINDSLLLTLSQQEDARREFPFLQKVANHIKAEQAAPVKKKSCCGASKKRSAASGVMEEVKAEIAGMGDVQKRKLKDMLSAKKVRVLYRTSPTAVQQVTF